jgi:AcrR family transcriptional regulator
MSPTTAHTSGPAPAPASGRAPAPGQTPQRRRGAALETALLEAALEELSDKGYSGFTFESVAARAQTSRAVLYRRWSSKPELVQAAILHALAQQPVAIPDTGALRDDLLELMRRTNRSRANIGAMVLLQLAAYFAETGTGPADLRAAFLPAGHTDAYDTVLARAVERGEIDEAKLTHRLASLPMDLLRQELMMRLKPVPDDVIVAIVDEIFLPLVRPQTRHRRAAQRRRV